MTVFINGVNQDLFNISHMDFWSIVDSCVTITSTLADIALPDVVVADVPSGVTITRALGMMKYAKAINTNAAVNNLVTGAATPALQMRVACGTFIDAHLIACGMIPLPACGREGGDIWMGSLCVAEEFTIPNATYNFQFCDADAAQNNIELKDLQTGVRIYWVD